MLVFGEPDPIQISICAFRAAPPVTKKQARGARSQAGRAFPAPHTFEAMARGWFLSRLPDWNYALLANCFFMLGSILWLASPVTCLLYDEPDYCFHLGTAASAL